MLITVMGVDGSGKSTLVERIGRYLRQRGRRAVLYRIRQEAPSIRIENRLFSLFPSLQGHTRKRLSSDTGDRAARKGALLGLLRLYALVMFHLDLAAFRRFARPRMNQGVDVVCDRYFDDVAAHLHFRGLINEREARGLVRRAMPPDVAVWMRVSDRDGRLRRPEHPRGYFRTKEQSYEIAFQERTVIVALAGESGAVFSDLERHLMEETGP